MLPKFDIFTPTTVKEASDLMLKYGKQARILAGGTDILVMLHEGKLEVDYLVDIKGIQELKGIEVLPDGGVKIGALTTFNEIVKHPYIVENYPVFVDGMDKIGSVQVRNLATIGGNICNAIPSADSAPALLALDAKIIADNGVEKREIALNEFFLAPRKTVLGEGEIVTAFIIPPMKANACAAYYKFMRRKAMDLALFGVAMYLEVEDNRCSAARVAMATAAPVTIRVKEAEEYLIGKELTDEVLAEAGVVASKAINPRTSYRSTAEYRKKLAAELTPRTAKMALARMK